MQHDENTGAQQAPRAPQPKNDEAQVQGRVLVDCDLGSPNDLISLPAEEAKAAVKAGLLDTSKPAVAYAASLQQSQQA